MKKIILVILCFWFFACHTSRNSTGGSQESTAFPSLFRIVESGKLLELINALKNKADPNVSDANGITPLMLAAEKNKGDFFRELIRFGAKVDMRNNAGQTALDMVKDPRSIEDIGKRIKDLDKIGDKTAAQKSELKDLTQLSTIKRYAKMANYEVPASFVEEPNPGAGSCYFYSIIPFLKGIPGIPNLYNDFAHSDDVRNFLRNFLLLDPRGQPFVNEWLPNMRLEYPNIYDRPGKEVITANDLVELITNTGKFAYETFWGDDLTDGIAKEAASLSTIKIRHRKFGTGEDIFYCYGEVDQPYVGIMKYYTDVHFEAMKFVELGKPAKYVFDLRGALPRAVKELIDTYKLCFQ